MLCGVAYDSLRVRVISVKLSKGIADFSRALNDDVTGAFTAHRTGHAAGFDPGGRGALFNRFGQNFAIGLIHPTLCPIGQFAGFADGDPGGGFMCNVLCFALARAEGKLKS